MGSIGRTMFRTTIGAFVVTLISLTTRQRRMLAPLARKGTVSLPRLMRRLSMHRQSSGQLGGGRC